jgi:hypothetical protein
MKWLLVIFFSFQGLFTGAPEVTDELISALKQGKASDLVRYFEEKVSVKLITQEDVLSRSQAEANLKFFFEKHPVKNLSAVHISTVNNAAQYLTATLETTNGRFRVSILIKRNMVSQFRIETDNE